MVETLVPTSEVNQPTTPQQEKKALSGKPLFLYASCISQLALKLKSFFPNSFLYNSSLWNRDDIEDIFIFSSDVAAWSLTACIISVV